MRSAGVDDVGRGVGEEMTKEEVMQVLHPITDPEIPFSIVDLGLVYDVEFPKEGAVIVKMTLTSPVCPAGPELMGKVEEAVKALPGVTEPHVELVWSPMWDPRTMATEDVQIELGLL